MRRITSTLLLGFVLALPLGASAGEKSDNKSVEIAAASVDAGPTAPKARTETKKAEQRDSGSKVRGSRNVDPGVRFNNPYAFPLQTLPISLPNLTTISF